jgi:hypothetical protein
MDDDIAAIEKWAQIFEHPAHLIERGSKNWVINYSELN